MTAMSATVPGLASSEGITIGELAASSGLSVHTLRYYEKIGLLRAVRRQPNGRRLYGPQTAERAEALSYLRASGLSIEGMRTYVRNLDRGDAAAADHARLLYEHARAITEQIRRLEEQRDYITAKARYWQEIAEMGRHTERADALISQARRASARLR